jgi:short-subunit dehydrogenase
MRLHPKHLAVVTGASGGIGEAFARQLAGRGLNLVLVARSADKLELRAAELRAAHGITVDVRPADLADPAAVAALAAELFGPDAKPVDLLVNNAGLGFRSEFATQTDAQIGQMLGVNIDALVKLTRAALPGLLARRAGAVLNVASTAAFQPVPLVAIYAATKAFVLSFSEAVDREVRPQGAQVMALCPGPVKTGFGDAAGMAARLFAHAPTADECARIGLKGLEAGRTVKFVRAGDYLTTKPVSLMPRRWVTKMAMALMRK